MDIHVRQTILEAAVDQAKLDYRARKKWSKAMLAQSLTPSETDQLYPSAFRVERISLPDEWDTVIGGICHIYSGDLTGQPDSHRKQAAQLLRIDQIFENVGLVKDKTIFFIAEDYQFTGLADVKVTTFQEQAHDLLGRTEKLASYMDVKDLVMVLSSDIEDAICEQVNRLTQYIGNPDFAGLHKAPTLLTYTQLWTEMLHALGHIPSINTVCLEPSVHFYQPQVYAEKWQQRAYDDYINWLKANPPTQPNGINEHFGVAGMYPTWMPVTNKRSRLEPFTKVPNTQNVSTWITKITAQAEVFPFTLRENPIYLEAVNYLTWNPSAVEHLFALALLQNDYREERKHIDKSSNARLAAAKLRKAYDAKARIHIETLVTKLSDLYRTVLG